jgi:cysteine-rich repeat protein
VLLLLPPDLVAYWDFNSGAGYSIKDITNHGHDLIAAQPPRWEVVRWLSNCGNGVVEGAEECDDGDTVDGDGCSSSCKVERGWSCNGNPSKCSQGGSGGGGAPTPAPAPRPEPRPTPRPAGPSGGGSGGGSHSDAAQGGGKRSSGGSIAAAVLVPVFVAVLGGMMFAYRHAVYEQFPQVRLFGPALNLSSFVVHCLLQGSWISTSAKGLNLAAHVMGCMIQQHVRVQSQTLLDRAFNDMSC